MAIEKHLQLFIRYITTAAANASLYHLEHPQVMNLCLQAHDQLKILHSENPAMSLKIVEGKLIYADKPVDTNLSVERLIDALTSMDISYLDIAPGIQSEELLILADTLGKRPGKTGTIRQTEHISAGQIEVRRSTTRETDEEKISAVTDFSEIADMERDKFLEIYHGINRKKQLNVVGISEIVGNFVDAFSSHSNVMMAIAPLRSMDEYAYAHSTNICLLNISQAKLLGISGPLLNDIGIAAMLHDVGKMFISPDILNKKGKLDEKEWTIMQSHPQLGAEYLMNTPGIPRLAIITAYEHHIGYNGKGYPATPENWRLNTCSYMTSISDVYDALRTRRSYKEPLSFQQISEIMTESAGKALHPELTQCFLSALKQTEEAPH